MIIFLLLVIIAILLFGSSAVLGAIGLILGLIAGLMAVGMALEFWSTLSFVEQILVVASPVIAIVLLFGIFILFGLLDGQAQTPGVLFEIETASAPHKDKPYKSAATSRVWGWYADEIQRNFDERGKAEAARLYAMDDANNLDRFCRSEIARISGSECQSDVL